MNTPSDSYIDAPGTIDNVDVNAKKNTINAKVCLLSIYVVYSIWLYVIYNHDFIKATKGIMLKNNNNVFYIGIKGY